jgi:hypothetical protein
MAANNTSLGGWLLNTTTDKFEAVGDFDGDGKTEILVSNQSKIGILKLQGNTLITICTVNTGDRLGGWTLDSKNNKLNTIGDFDGDRKAEILVTGDAGLCILKLNGTALNATLTAPNGTRFGGWLLNTRDNRLDYAADFDGDGKTEIMILSPWGMGILKQFGSTFNAVTMSPNGTRFGSWLLNTADNDLEAGLGQSFAVIVYHSQWQGAVDSTAAYLRKRGYTVFVFPNGANGAAIIKNLSLYLKSNDRLFVYLAGHGATGRAVNDMTKDVSITHWFQFEDGAGIGYNQFAPSFQLMGNKGVDLTVFDGSCDAGEAVMNAMGERYLAISTTAIHSPAITGIPNPAEIMQLFGKPNKFGMWWSPYHTASLMTSKTPARFYQKIFRNDNTEINILSLFYKPGIDFYTTLGAGWYMWAGRCYLYRYIYPNEYNGIPQNEKDEMTRSVSDYIATMRTSYDSFVPSITSLKRILGNAPLINSAADIYSQFYPKPWQTINGDMSWNVIAEPIRRSRILNNAIEPRSYEGKPGFLRMINEILNLLELLQQSYARQETLLTEIDVEVMSKNIFKGLIKKQALPEKKITDYLRYNEYEKKLTNSIKNVLSKANVDQTLMFKTLGEPVQNIQKQNELKSLLKVNIDQIKQHLSETAFDMPSLEDLIAELKGVVVESIVCLDKLDYLLIITEEAISRAQANRVEAGDLVNY